MTKVFRLVLDAAIAIGAAILLVKAGEFLSNLLVFRKNPGLPHLMLSLLVWVFVGLGMGFAIIWFVRRLH